MSRPFAADTLLTSRLTAVKGSVGTLDISTVSSGDSDPIFNYQPNEVTSPPFDLAITRYDNAFGSRSNYVSSWGWNVNGSVSGEAQIQFTIEDYFRPNSGHALSEFYIATNSDDGTNPKRPFSIDLDRISGTATVAFNGVSLRLQDVAGSGSPFWVFNLSNGQASTNTGDAVPLLITTNANIPAIRQNGVDLIRDDGASDNYQVHIAQDNVRTIIGNDLLIGELGSTGSGLHFRSNAGNTVGDGNTIKFAMNANGAFMCSWNGLAYQPMLAPFAEEATAGSLAYYLKFKDLDGTNRKIPVYNDA